MISNGDIAEPPGFNKYRCKSTPGWLYFAKHGFNAFLQIRTRPAMTDTQLLQEFEALAERLDIPVTYANLEGGEGGLCVVRGKHRFILNRSPDVRTHIEIFARDFARLSLDDVYIRPLVRERIDAVRSTQE
jgi:hypothetical protein